MHARCKRQPQKRTQVFLLQHSRDREDASECRQISRVQILVYKIERRARDRDGQKRCHQANATPASGLPAGGKQSAQLPASCKKKKDRRDMPEENRSFQGKMRDSHREGNDVWEESESGMRLKKFTPHRKQFRVQNLLNAGQIYFGVLRPGMVAMNYQGPCCQQKQDASRFISVG
jgi:hypothetical protein